MKARDLILPGKDYLMPDNTLKEAVNLLRSAERDEKKVGVRILPDLDDRGNLVGLSTVNIFGTGLLLLLSRSVRKRLC